MRKPRDYGAELKQLNDRTRDLRHRKLVQLGELVSATAADTLPVEMLAGVLLSAVDNRDTEPSEGWRRRGAKSFCRKHNAGGDADSGVGGEPAGDGTASPPTSPPGVE